MIFNECLPKYVLSMNKFKRCVVRAVYHFTILGFENNQRFEKKAF